MGINKIKYSWERQIQDTVVLWLLNVKGCLVFWRSNPWTVVRKTEEKITMFRSPLNCSAVILRRHDFIIWVSLWFLIRTNLSTYLKSFANVNAILVVMTVVVLLTSNTDNSKAIVYLIIQQVSPNKKEWSSPEYLLYGGESCTK